MLRLSREDEADAPSGWRGGEGEGWDPGNSGGGARGLPDNTREKRMEHEPEVLLLTPSVWMLTPTPEDADGLAG